MENFASLTPATDPATESARLLALQRYAVLDTPPEAEFDDFTRIAAQICGTPIALLSLVDSTRQWFKSRIGLDGNETLRGVSFCTHAIQGREIFEVPDALEDPRFKQNPSVVGEPHIRFYAGAPLVTPDGHAIGTLCVIDASPRRLSPDQAEALACLARRVVSQLEFRLAARRLRESELALEQRIEERTAELARQEQFNRLLLENLEEGVVACDAEGRLLLLNRTAREWHGIDAADPSPSAWSHRCRLFEADGVTPLPADRLPLLRVLQGERVRDVEVAIVNEGAAPRYLSVNGALLPDGSGRSLGAVVVMRDITERRVAEAIRRQDEARFRQLVELLPIGVYLCDAAGVILQYNQAAVDLWGREPGSGDPEPLFCASHRIHRPDGTPLPHDKCPMAETIRTGLPYRNAAIVLERPDGTRASVVVNTVAIKNERGEVVGAINSLLDLTGRKFAEEAVVTKQRQLVEAEQAAQMGGFDLEIESGKLALTEGLCRIFGQNPATFQPTFEQLLEQIHPEDLERVRTMAREAVGDAGAFHLDSRILRPDGQVRVVDIRGRIVKGARGRRLRLVGVCQDITDRREAERQLRLSEHCINRASVATYWTGPDGRLVRANEAACRLLGYSEEELLRLSVPDFNPELARGNWTEHWRELRRVRRMTTEYRLVRKDGTTFPAELVLNHVSFEGREYKFVFVRDLTERREAERQLLRAQRLESIGTIASGVAHDVNNALAPIMLGVELLKLKHSDDTEILDMFENSARRGADLVRQLLTFARGAEGERVSLQPGRLVTEMQKLIKGSFPKNIQLVVKCDPKLPLIVGDSTQLHQILMNLCVNARDAMPQGGTLTLEAQRLDVDEALARTVPEARPGPYVVFRVRDTGVGIPPEIFDRILEPFFTTKSPDKGTGLGLSTVAGIIKGHGGFLHIQSSPGQGSTFAAHLPIDRSEAATAVAMPEEDAFRGNGETVLLVDDEPAVRQMARKALRQLNLRPVVAADGVDGLMQIAEHRDELRVIVTDMHMPQMDGLAYTRALRRILPDIPVVIASGRLDPETAVELKGLGVTHHLAKPFSSVELAAVLQRILAV